MVYAFGIDFRQSVRPKTKPTPNPSTITESPCQTGSDTRRDKQPEIVGQVHEGDTAGKGDGAGFCKESDDSTDWGCAQEGEGGRGDGESSDHSQRQTDSSDPQKPTAKAGKLGGGGVGSAVTARGVSHPAGASDAE
jgi:hypothetical protein